VKRTTTGEVGGPKTADAGPRVGPFVRGYLPGDHDALYDICVRTGDAGSDATGMFAHADLIPDIWAGPYIELEPELAFVLDDGGTAVGYVIGTADTAAFVRSYRQRWIPHLAGAYAEPSDPPADSEEALISFAFQPERMLNTDLDPYPAHLHINILPPYQGSGYGRRLIERFFESAARAGAEGVHVVVARTNTRAHGFYQRVGFQVLETPSESGGAIFYGRRLGGAAS
jgi:ribosomal protein S18 acetylase RimI-like enzyme